MKHLYCLTFANGKQYIGQTTNCYGRMATHKHEAFVLKNDLLLYNAWRKYGDPSFQILAIVELEMIDELEIKAIKIFNTRTPAGYNITKGGERGMTGLTLPKEVREKMSKSQKGRIVSDETKRKIGEANRGKVRSADLRKQWSEKHTGKILSEEHKQKIGAAHKGRVFSQETIEKIKQSNKRTWAINHANSTISSSCN